MLPGVNGSGQGEEAVPDLKIIKEILLSDMRRMHEARMERLEERIEALSKQAAGQLAALAARVEAVAAGAEQSQKMALSEIAEAISQIALGPKHGEGTPDHVGS